METSEETITPNSEELSETTEEVEEERSLTPSDSGDELDAISDPEKLREKAKEFRRVATKAQAKVVAKEETPKETKEQPQTPFLTQEAFERANEKKAIRIATQASEGDPLKVTKEEINANWDEIKEFYRPLSGRDTPEDIVDDIFDAHAVWKRRGGVKVEKPNPAGELSTIAKATGSKAAPETIVEKKVDPRFQKPKGPEKWYPPISKE